MILTLFVIIDDTKKERKIFYDMEHSNWHHIKILQHLMKHFQYDMFGEKHSSREDLTTKKIIQIYKENSNGLFEDFEEIKDFRSLKLDECSIDGYVIIHIDEIQNIYLKISSMEEDRENSIKDFRSKIKELKRKNDNSRI